MYKVYRSKYYWRIQTKVEFHLTIIEKTNINKEVKQKWSNLISTSFNHSKDYKT